MTQNSPFNPPQDYHPAKSAVKDIMVFAPRPKVDLSFVARS
jgi:hypothetical protein